MKRVYAGLIYIAVVSTLNVCQAKACTINPIKASQARLDTVWLAVNHEQEENEEYEMDYYEICNAKSLLRKYNIAQDCKNLGLVD